jgi:hypothetical protein
MDYFISAANEERKMASSKMTGAVSLGPCRTIGLTFWLGILFAAYSMTGCDQQPAPPKSDSATEAKPSEPAVPDDVKSAAESLLGKESQVLLFGDLAKNGKQQFLAANVVPKNPKNATLGTVVTRAVIAQNENGKWMEIFRCDEYLKNARGFLAGTPLGSVSGWRIQYEQSADKGLQLYLTPMSASGSHAQPIAVGWNPAVKRYQSLDRGYEHFLSESSTLEPARSVLR